MIAHKNSPQKILKAISQFFWTIWYFIKGTYRRFHEDDLLFMASGLSFNGILCVIPLLLLLTSLLGVFLSSSYLAIQQLDEVLKAAFPAEPYAESIKSSIRQVLLDIMTFKTSYGLIGMGVLTWTATSLFSATRTILNRIYKCKSSKLVLLTIVEDFLWVFLVGILFIITSIFPWLMSFSKSLVSELPRLQNLHLEEVLEFVPGAISLVLTLVMFFILYRFIPDHGVNTKVAIISAITTTTLWVTAGKLFNWYLSTFHSFTKLYGTYAFLLVFIVWIYYSSVVFIVGAIIGQLYKEYQKD
ncbi:MAG: YihY/virulence factor BrkB family protein [Bacteroidetes bacterium]|nr:MAG: YihY/virulence factor BrkB family protein [Bacteroidota bacterium]